MQVHAVSVREVRERPHLVRGVDDTRLGDLRDRHDARLGVVLDAVHREQRLDIGGPQLPSTVLTWISRHPLNRSTAPHSSTAMCALAAHTTASPCWRKPDSAVTFAPSR